MAFHPYPQLIPPVFNLGGFGPPHALTRASTWPWVDHPASGPERATTLALFGLALATATPHGLTSRHATDSQAHSSKGTPPPPHKRVKALTACKRPVSGTISLPSRGTFHHSLTVLSTIGHQEVFRQPSGLGRFTQDSTSPVLLGHHPRHAPTSSAYGGITHYATPSQTIQLQISTRAPSPAEEDRTAPQPRTRNPCRVSHAHGLTIIRFRSPLLTEYLLLRVLRCFTSPRNPPHPINSDAGDTP